MMASGLRNTAVAAGRAILLSAGFAGLGAALAPTDWPQTTSVYNLHKTSPAMNYAFWGVAIALGSQTARRFVKSMRARHFDWRPSIFDVCFLLAWSIATYGTLPYCICDPIPTPTLIFPSSQVTFGGEAPEPSEPTLNTPSSH